MDTLGFVLALPVLVLVAIISPLFVFIGAIICLIGLALIVKSLG